MGLHYLVKLKIRFLVKIPMPEKAQVNKFYLLTLIFTVLHVMQRTVLLSQFCPYVCPSDACIVTKLNDGLRTF